MPEPDEWTFVINGGEFRAPAYRPIEAELVRRLLNEPVYNPVYPLIIDRPIREQENTMPEINEAEDEAVEVIICTYDGCEATGVRRVGSAYRCEDHGRRCYHCGRRRLTEAMTQWDLGWAETYFCDNCMSQCADCDERVPVSELAYVDNFGHTCPDCREYCNNCGGNYVRIDSGDDCIECRNSGDGRDVEPYGHTRGHMWLGGPVKARGGYYLGFELEITTPEYAAGTPVKEWAAVNLGDRDAMSCKEDSSVEGFEIVTQPMTPDFFESVDWDGFFDMLEESYPMNRSNEPDAHGLHVHIGRRAFDFNDMQIAAFSYLIAQDDHLVRVARRQPTGYCRKTEKPVSQAIMASSGKRNTRHYNRIYGSGYYGGGRDAINLNNTETIEIRAFRSTRKADDLRNAVRFVYVAAEYVRHLSAGKKAISPRALHWAEFSKWVAVNQPHAYNMIADIPGPKIKPENKKAITARTEVNTLVEEQEPFVVAGSIRNIAAPPTPRPASARQIPETGSRPISWSVTYEPF